MVPSKGQRMTEVRAQMRVVVVVVVVVSYHIVEKLAGDTASGAGNTPWGNCGEGGWLVCVSFAFLFERPANRSLAQQIFAWRFALLLLWGP